MLKSPWLYAAVCVFAVTAACGVSTPLSPVNDMSHAPATGIAATLKVTAPSPVSPINGDTTATTTPTFTATPVTGQFSTSLSGLTYEFELYDAAGNRIDDTFKPDPTWTNAPGLNGDTLYRWRARGTLGSATGPWSSMASFRTPVPPPTLSCPNKDNKRQVSDWFFQVAASVGATVNSVQTRTAMNPAFQDCNVAWQNITRGLPGTRARFFLPPLSQPNLDSAWWVDTGDEGRGFVLTFRY